MNRGGGEGSGEGGGEESLSSFFSSVLSHLHKEYRVYFDVQHTQKVRGSSITNPILNMLSGTCILYCFGLVEFMYTQEAHLSSWQQGGDVLSSVSSSSSAARCFSRAATLP